MVSFTATPTAADLVLNAMAVARSSVSMIAVGTFATAVSIVGLAVGIVEPFTPILLFGGVTILTGAFIAPFVWWAIRQRRDLVLTPMEVVAAGDGLSLSTRLSRARYEWSVFRRARETSQAFLLETDTNAALMLPKRGASDAEVQGLRRLLAHLGLLDSAPGTRLNRRLAGVALGLAAAVVTIGLPIILRA